MIAYCTQTDSNGVCIQGHPLQAIVTNVDGGIFGLGTDIFTGPGSQYQFNPGPDQTVDIGHGVSVSGLNVTSPGSIQVSIGSETPDPAYRAVPQNMAFNVSLSPWLPGSPPFYSGSLRLNMDFGALDLTAAQLKALRLVAVDPGSLSPPLPISITGTTATFTIDPTQGPITFMAMAPQSLNPVAAQDSGFTLTYDGSLNSPITMQAANPSTGTLATLLTQARMLGLVPLGPLEQLTSSGVQISSYSSIIAPYTPISTVPVAGVYLLTPGAAPQLLPGQFSNYLYNVLSASLQQVNGYVGVFGRGMPSDLTPPVTQIAFSSSAVVDQNGVVDIATSTLVSFVAYDPSGAGVPTSGVATTYYLIDVPFVSLSSTPATIYSAPFTLSLGTHTIAYFSVDHAGNFETAHSTTVFVGVPAVVFNGAPGNGQAIGLDAAGQLWEVVASTDGSSLSLSRFSADSSTLLSSAVLPQVAQKNNWSIQFDAAGDAYVIGGSNPPSGGTDLAIYQISPQGVLLSTAGFHGGALGNSLAFDATSGVWIAGALQTGSLKNGTAQAQLALWRFNPANGSVALAAAYARGNGGDLGFGVRVSSSIVWVAGYSAATSAGLGGAMDLALWGFDVSSGTLVRGPFFVPGVLPNGLPNGFGGKLDAVGGDLYVAGTRQSSTTAQTGFYEFDSSGHLLLSRSWTPASGLTPQVNAIVHDSAGHIAAAGQVGNSGTSTLAVWSYGQDGSFSGAFTDPAAPGGATGMALSTNAFLSLSGSGSPYPFKFKTSLAGTDSLLSSGPTDVLPPRTALKIGVPQAGAAPVFIATTTPLSLSAVDDLTTVGDGMGLGVAQSFVAVDSGAFAVYTGTFTLAAPGPHQIRFYSVDKAGNTEVVRSTQVAVDGLPPRTSVAFSTPEFLGAGLYLTSTSSITFSAGDDLAAVGDSSGVGVAQTLVSLDTGAFTPVAGATAIAAEGLHTLSWFSRDLLGNSEVVRSTSVAVDDTPPITTLAFLGGRQYPTSSGVYASSATRIAFASNDPAVNGVASGVAFTLWQDSGAALQVYASTLAFAEGAHPLSFQSQDNVQNLEVLRSTTVLIDATPPVTTVAIGAPSYTAPDSTLYVATTTPVSFTAADPILASSTVAGSGVNRIEVAVDTTVFTAYVSSLTFAEGVHTILYRAVDNVGNVEIAHSLALRADATPPVSAFVVGSPQFALSSATVLVSALTPIAVTAVDPASNGVASGVRQSFYAVNGSSFAVFTTSFTLAPPDGPQTISFYSQDNVSNTESVRVGAVVLDATPPTVALLSPGACPGGVCRVIKGKLPVLGTAFDAHFAGYELDFAPGQNAATGYALVSSGTVAVSSGALGTWDASALAGWQTLRLTATDLVANAAVVTENVFVGDPGELMILGNHDVFNMPQGVAADASGKVYVADTNASRIAIFTATGAFVSAYGAPAEDRDAASSTSTVRLNKPKGVAVDAAGNIFVADTNESRVLKLSAAGQLLLAIGRARKDGDERDGGPEFQPGKGPGEFNKPSGIAVGGDGRIYVADTNNDRVQIFSSTGAPLLAFTLPPLPKVHDDEKADHDDDRPTLGRPFGVAVDATGRIYVADPYGSRALIFGATGQLLLTLPITGTTKDGHVLPGRPEGIAVSTDGYCLLVSDHKFDRVLKFDALGDQTLIFGSPGHVDTSKPITAISFHKPVGLALALDGTLLVADRNNDRVERFGLPTGQAPLVTPPTPPDDPELLAQDVLDSDAGGSVARADDAGVTIPPGALSDDLKITVSTMSPQSAAMSDAMTQAAGAKGLAPAYAPVEYGPEGTQFNAPVTIVQPYDPNLIAAEGVSADSLQIHYWNKATGNWEALASSVDPTAHTVTAKTPHFSLYQVLGSTGTAPKPLLTADPTFAFRAGYAFPNPVRGTSAVTIRIQPGLADSVEVHVYDLSGRKVHSSSDFTQSILDDGNGLGAQYTFDHVWDISGVGSGVYMYVITARKAGMSDLHKSGKIGLIK